MYSQCPECKARFRVGAEALRAAGGTVRCGRCGSAFNALTWLSDTVPPSLGDPRAPRQRDGDIALPESTGPVTGTEFHFTADDIEKVFVDARGWRHRVSRDEPEEDVEESAAPGAEPPLVVVTESQPFEDITLEGELVSVESILGLESDEDATDEFAVVKDVPESAYPEHEDEQAAEALESESPVAAEEAALPGARHEASAPEVDVVDLEQLLAPAAATSATTGSAPATGIDDSRAEAALAPRTLDALRGRRSTDDVEIDWSAGRARRPTRSTLVWSAASLVMALALLAQLTHQFRQELVRHPRIGPLLTDIYGRLGVPLSPNWDLGAFKLRQWGQPGGPETNGRLDVRASITNEAAFAQPHPILRLELDDRFGDAVAVRDFEPAEYLENPSEASRQLAPRASTEADLVLVDLSPDAVGYQLDVCLRESATILRCARSPGS